MWVIAGNARRRTRKATQGHWREVAQEAQMPKVSRARCAGHSGQRVGESAGRNRVGRPHRFPVRTVTCLLCPVDGREPVRSQGEEC